MLARRRNSRAGPFLRPANNVWVADGHDPMVNIVRGLGSDAAGAALKGTSPSPKSVRRQGCGTVKSISKLLLTDGFVAAAENHGQFIFRAIANLGAM